MSLSIPMGAPTRAPAPAAIVQDWPQRLPRYLCWAIVAMLVTLTLLSRGGISIGDYTASFALPMVYLLIAKGLTDDTIRIDVPAFLLFAFTMSVAGLCLLATNNLENHTGATLSSAMLLGTLYLPFVFVMNRHPDSEAAWLWTMRLLSNIGLFVAIVGIFQFYLQFVFRPEWLFDVSLLLPDAIRGSGIYNSAIPVGSLFKSNGFFFREPSGFSFFMAFMFICELALFKRIPRMAVYAFGLLLSYSGTGMLALAIGLMFPFGMKTAMRIAVIVGVGLLAFLLLGDALNLSFTLGRIGEFSSERSSGYIRYVAPARLISEMIDSTPWTAFLGHGPGTIFKAAREYEFHDPTWAKLLYEYGLLGFTGFVAMMWMAMRRSGAPIQIRATVFFYWLVMGGHLLTPDCVLLVYVLLGIWPKPLTPDPRPVGGPAPAEGTR